MDSKTRVKTSLAFKEPDRVPVDYWADKLITKKLIKTLGAESTEDLLQQLGIDIRFIEGSVYTGPRPVLLEDGSSNDIWGVRRKTILVDETNPEKGSYEHVNVHPLATAETVKEIEEYKGWPSPDWFDYSQVESQADKFPGMCVVCGGDRLNRVAQFKPAMYLRGVEQCVLDLAMEPVIMEAIIEREVHFYLEYTERIFKNANGKIDVFFMGDDFGTQKGLMMSMDAWRKFFKPGLKKYIDLSHKYGIKVMHHTCGAVYDLIPEFIDCGMDILQSLQPNASGMDAKKIKQEYGKDICFQGGIDIQKVMPFGTPKEVDGHVLDRIKLLGPGGGYILCTSHNIQPDTPVENVLAYFEAAKRYGAY